MELRDVSRFRIQLVTYICNEFEIEHTMTSIKKPFDYCTSQIETATVRRRTKFDLENFKC